MLDVIFCFPVSLLFDLGLNMEEIKMLKINFEHLMLGCIIDQKPGLSSISLLFLAQINILYLPIWAGALSKYTVTVMHSVQIHSSHVEQY